MVDHVRWGILGAANFAAEHMGPALHAAPGGKLSALATSDAAKAAPFRALAPEIAVHEDYDALLADPEIDAVYVPLPNHLHVEWGLKALDAGKHVLIEKPVAMEAEQIDRLIASRDTAGRLAAEAFMIVHHPQWHRARNLLADGAVGKLRMVQAAFSFDNGADTTNIRNRPETGGGGLRDIGVYVFGAVRFATSEEPESLSARIDWESGVDVFAAVDARFPSFDYAAYVGMRLHPRQEVVFHGDGGLLRLTAPFNAQAFGEATVILDRPGFEILHMRFPSDRQYELQVAAFNRSVLDGAAYPCPLEFSRGTQAMMDRAFASAGPPPS